MKKFYYIVGAVVTAAAIFTLIAVMLKKLRISLCIEGIDDDMLEEETEHDDITLSFDDENDEELFDDSEIEPEIETVIADDQAEQI